MSSLRSRALVLLVAAVGSIAVAGCGQSELQKEAVKANDTINTTAEAADAAKADELAKENARLDQQDRKDRKGLAKDLVDAVNGTADGVKADAKKQADDAQDQAKDAAANALSDAQKQVEKAQQAVKDNAANAQDDISKALSDAAAATSP